MITAIEEKVNELISEKEQAHDNAKSQDSEESMNPKEDTGVNKESVIKKLEKKKQSKAQNKAQDKDITSEKTTKKKTKSREESR